jgi:hypothetical protein
MKHEYMSIGYIRTNCLSKLSHLVNDFPITKFGIARSQQDKKKVDSKYRWLNFTITGTGNFSINWDVWRDRTSFQNVLNALSDFRKKYHFDDFVVNKIEVGIDDPTLTTLINKKLEEQGIKQKYKHNERFYVAFGNNPLAYDVINGWDAEIISKININAIINQKFKRGTLDIKSIESSSKKAGRYAEDLDFAIHDKDICKYILSKLNTNRWYTFPEVKECINPETGKQPKPGAIRTYERKSTNKWSFISDEEV